MFVKLNPYLPGINSTTGKTTSLMVASRCGFREMGENMLGEIVDTRCEASGFTGFRAVSVRGLTNASSAYAWQDVQPCPNV